MKTLTLVFLLSFVVLYTGCHSKKVEKTKNIEMSVVRIVTNQSRIER